MYSLRDSQNYESPHNKNCLETICVPHQYLETKITRDVVHTYSAKTSPTNGLFHAYKEKSEIKKSSVILGKS